ncbi:MAG: GNAT family N-acetyltransferase [Chloroflexota bacterium]
MSLEENHNQFFPVNLPMDVVARGVDKATVFEINAATRIFKPDEMGLYQTPSERLAANKRLSAQYVHSGAEAVAFYDQAGAAVGWFWGYLEDRETFLIDTFGLIPAFRGHGIYQAFIRVLLSYLEAVGCERVTVHTHPNNRAMLIANLKAGFNIAAMEMNESSGVLIKLVYLLHEDRRRDFSQAFRLLPVDHPEAKLR